MTLYEVVAKATTLWIVLLCMGVSGYCIFSALFMKLAPNATLMAKIVQRSGFALIIFGILMTAASACAVVVVVVSRLLHP